MRAALLSAAILASCAPTAVTVAADTPPRRQHMEQQPMPDAPPRTTTTHTSRGTPRTTVGGGVTVGWSGPISTPAGPCGGWRTLVARYFPAAQVDNACRVLWCESRGRPDARQGRYAGLFQVGGGSTAPEANVAQAAAMWAKRGWQPWTCRP